MVADDHPLFRDALRQAVATVVASARVDEAGSFEELTALLERESDVDLILLDLSMPGISGFSGLIYLRAQFPAIPVVIVSASDDAGTIRRSMDFGASGFIPKRFGVETLREAIGKVMNGDVWVPADVDLSAAADPDMTKLRDRLVTLTPQQVRVLMMLSEGLLNKQIAYELGVSEATIKAHVSAILQKLGVESRTQAVIAAAKIAAESGNSPTRRSSSWLREHLRQKRWIMIEAVIWDFGGVLTTSPFEAFARFEKERGLPRRYYPADQRREPLRECVGEVRARRSESRDLR